MIDKVNINKKATTSVSKRLGFSYFYAVSVLLILTISSNTLQANKLSKETILKIEAFLNHYAKNEQKLSIGKIRIDSTHVDLKKKKISLFANDNCSYISYNNEVVETIYKGINNSLPETYSKFSTSLLSENQKIENFRPFAHKKRFVTKANKPLVSPYRNFTIDKGLENRHIALWQSHGWYYEQKLARWEWQRARIFQTVEDLYTQSFVLPYLVPMLENAGANILLPRERDLQRHEIIVDNDGSLNNSQYTEITNDWLTGKNQGFAHKKSIYKDYDNPFKDGTYRYTKTTTKKDKTSFLEWTPNIPESGKYAVYVSYKTLKNSSEDAQYSVHHRGGVSRFSVNQKMGGGTWIYLGHFEFDKGLSNKGKVVLDNTSSKNGKILTADAVKFGGGMGNIARIVGQEVTENVKSSEQDINILKQAVNIEYKYETSTYPRYNEAARYWLQWAGIPDSIYSPKQGSNDYIDDYQSRGLWANYLAGGSSVLPKKQGLNIPIDLAFAFHSDAGTTMNDSTIGTLGIYYAPDGENFKNGITKRLSHDLTETIQSEIVNDVRAEFDPKWSRRGKWNKAYSEAKIPEVPSMLLELLSHQNFSDMRYGLDPRFKFAVSRAIYKGMLKYLAYQYKQDYVVQPLPVDNMSVEFVGENEIELKWQAVEDKLEPTAKADKYIVYTKIGDGAFDLGNVVVSNSYKINVEPDQHYSFKVAALNEGGKSFDSETLSICKVTNSKGIVLIVNGFDRVSAPDSFDSGEYAGFNSQFDNGVPYFYDASFIGKQKEFRRSIPWMDDDASGFGDSYSNYETTVIAGNTFDYPSIHGTSIAAAGYSYVSCSNEAVENGYVKLNNYNTIDYILGLQKETKIGTSPYPSQFKTFSKTMQSKIKDFCNNGGNIFVSGAFVGTDIWDNGPIDEEDKEFAEKVLKYKWRARQACREGQIRSVASPFQFDTDFEFYSQLNEKFYAVESPDAIEPADPNSFTIFRYRENNLSMGIAYANRYKTCILGIPFESIKKQDKRNYLMYSILKNFE